MTLASQATKVVDPSKHAYIALLTNALITHLLLFYFTVIGIDLYERNFCSIFFNEFFHLDLEITKVTEQLLQAIANSDYDMYKYVKIINELPFFIN